MRGKLILEIELEAACLVTSRAYNWGRRVDGVASSSPEYEAHLTHTDSLPPPVSKCILLSRTSLQSFCRHLQNQQAHPPCPKPQILSIHASQFQMN